MERLNLETCIYFLLLLLCLFKHPARTATITDSSETESLAIDVIGILSDPEKRVFLLIPKETRLPLNIQFNYWANSSRGNPSQIYTQTTHILSHLHSVTLDNQVESEVICLQFHSNFQDKKCVVHDQNAFTELPAPQEVYMNYNAFKYEITWKYDNAYSNLSLPNTIAFEVEYFDIFFKKWSPVSDCHLVRGLQCVLVEKKQVIPVDNCPEEESDAGEKIFRVKPCLLLHSQACGKWIKAKAITLGEKELPKPTNVHIKSINFNNSITWEYNNVFSSEFLRNKVTFSVEFFNNWYKVWMPVPECHFIHELYCDLFCSYYDSLYEDECPDYSMKGTVRARVKACVNSGLNGCGESVEAKSIDLSDDVILAPPDFSIIGLFDDYDLRILNKPHMVSYTHKKLSCYFNDALFYEIIYYGKNDDALPRQDMKKVSFDMDVISLTLKHKPKNYTLMCVKMRLYDDIDTVFSDWREICEYLHVNKTNLEPSLHSGSFTAIYVVAGFSVMVLLIVSSAIGCYLKRRIKSAYIKDKKIPKELEETMQRLNEDRHDRGQPDYVVMSSRQDPLGNNDSSAEVIHPLILCPNFDTQSQESAALHLDLNAIDIRMEDEFVEDRISSPVASLHESSFIATLRDEDSMKYVQEAAPDYTITNSVCNPEPNERDSPSSSSSLERDDHDEKEDHDAIVPQAEELKNKGAQLTVQKPSVKVVTYSKTKLIKSRRIDGYNLRKKNIQRHPNVKRWGSITESRSMSHSPLDGKPPNKKSTVIYTTPVHAFSESQEDITKNCTVDGSKDSDFKESLKDRLRAPPNGMIANKSFKDSKGKDTLSANDLTRLHVREVKNPTYSLIRCNGYCDDGSYSNIYKPLQIDKNGKEKDQANQSQCYLSMDPLNQRLSSHKGTWKMKNATGDEKDFCSQTDEPSDSEIEKLGPSTFYLVDLPKANRASTFHKHATKRQKEHRGTTHGVSSVFINPRAVKKSRSFRSNARQGSSQNQSEISSAENYSHVSSQTASASFGDRKRSRTDSCRSEDSGLPHDWPSISDDSPSPQCSPRDLMFQQTKFSFHDEHPNLNYSMESFMAHPETTTLHGEQTSRHLAHSSDLPEITESPVSCKEQIKLLETGDKEEKALLLSNNIVMKTSHLDNDSYVKLASLSQYGAK